MQIGLSTLNEIGTNYYIKLNDKELLVVEEDPLSKISNEKSSKDTKELKAEKTQEEDKKTDKPKNPNELSQEEQQVVNELSSRDAEVRQHESAHKSAGGGMASGASYTYQQGPDGKMYAIGGEVSISSKGGSTPEEAIANARQIQAAALAPASPSGQDFSVAASAKMMEMKAQQQLTKEQMEKMQGKQNYQNGDSVSQTQDTNKDEQKPFDIFA